MPQLTTLIPSFAAPVTDRVWLVGAHGGAGCTTIRHSDPERFADAGRALPVSQDPSMPSRIILCAMGTGRGLESLRALLADQSAGLFGASILLGAAITDPVPPYAPAFGGGAHPTVIRRPRVAAAPYQRA